VRRAQITKSQLPAVRRNLGMTIAQMAKAIGLKDPTYYYYETRFAGDVLPKQISDKIVKLARQNGSRIPRRRPVEEVKHGANDNGAGKRRMRSKSQQKGGSDLSRAVRETILALQKLEVALGAH
jgi:DNA-binding XRE family transcriptional regulator